MAGGKGLHTVTWILVIIGGLNWLLYGLFHWEVGSLLGGMDGMIARIVYLLVGLSAIYEIMVHGKKCRDCKPDGVGTQGQPGQM